MTHLKVHRDGRSRPLLLVAGTQKFNLGTQLAFLHATHPLDPERRCTMPKLPRRGYHAEVTTPTLPCRRYHADVTTNILMVTVTVDVARDVLSKVKWCLYVQFL